MQIQSVRAYSTLSTQNSLLRQNQASALTTATTSVDRATISQAAQDLLATQSNSTTPIVNGATAVFETDQGSMTV